MSGDPKKKKKLQMSDVAREAKHIVHTHRKRLAVGLVLMIINRLAGLVAPGSSKFLYDNVLENHQTGLLIPLAVAVGVAAIIQSGTSFALSQILSVAAQRAITDMRRQVQAHVARLPVRYFDTTKTGVLISRVMTDAEGIRNLVGTGLVRLLGGLFTAAIALGVLFWLNWKLTAMTITVLAVFGGAMTLAFNKLRPIFRERGRLNAEVTGRLGESLGGIRVVKAYVAERGEELVFTRGVHGLFRNVARSITGISTLTAFTTLVMGAIAVLMIMVGGRAVLAGTMTKGDLVTYVMFTGLVAFPLVSIAEIGTQITEAFAGLDRIRELERMATEDDDDAGREPLGQINGDIRFEDVWFEYEAGKPVLKGVSFVSPPGTTTALVGSSGSGKSTLISLVMAFNRPQRGAVFVDGRDLSTIRLREYRRALGVVLQENFLFDGTIAENIQFAKPDASAGDIEEAARVANAHDFITEFEHGYATIVGERGVKLSGGQRQRIAIARAILADPTILILDEATSSLDSESEALIQEGLGHLRAGRTTFVIAHRLSTIRSADQILVLEDGRIVERGRHVELMALGGRYRDLHDRQHTIEENLYINPGEDPSKDQEEEAGVPAIRPVDPRNL